LTTVKAIVKAGGIGINIEDFAHATKTLFPVERQVKNVKEIKRLGHQVGIPLVINARTDALRFGMGDDEAKFEEAVGRASAYRDAGADCVYPMGLTEAAAIERFVKELDFPINVMVRKGLPTVNELQRLGVARLSFGPSASYAAMGLLKRASNEVFEKGTYQNLIDGAIGFDELNSLALPNAHVQTEVS
jgi:2-methylisocitrate lyase-like PEP mutase family enzyme